MQTLRAVYVGILFVLVFGDVTGFISPTTTEKSSRFLGVRRASSNEIRLNSMSSAFDVVSNFDIKQIAQSPSSILPLASKNIVVVALTLSLLVITIVMSFVRSKLWKPSRTYDREANTVGREYDAWTTEGILEAYWGEHSASVMIEIFILK